MRDDTIFVAICLDERMLDAAMVLLASIKANVGHERPVTVFALTTFDTPDLPELAATMNDRGFTLVPMPVANVYDTFPARDHITQGTYLRFLLPEMLPDVRRVLYLDVDIVVHRDLAALFDTPLEGCALAAMPDWPMLLGSLTWRNFAITYGSRSLDFASYAREVLGFDGRDPTVYFNCGVMLLDLAVWRAEDIVARTIGCLTMRTDLFYMDQDALNLVVGGAYVRLDPRWNAFAICSFPAYVNALVRRHATGRRWEAIRSLWRRDPWIVHYAGSNKPWTPGDPFTAHDALWWSYAARAPLRARILDAYRARESAAQARRSKVPRALRSAAPRSTV